MQMFRLPACSKRIIRITTYHPQAIHLCKSMCVLNNDNQNFRLCESEYSLDYVPHQMQAYDSERRKDPNVDNLVNSSLRLYGVGHYGNSNRMRFSA